MSSNHHFSELSVYSFKYFSIFGELLPDIFWTDEDVDENTPVFLHFEPFINNNVYSSEFISPIFDGSNEILYVFTLSFHPHKIKWVRIQNLHHVVKRSKDVIFFVSIKSEDLLSPVTFNDFEFLVDLELLLRNVNNLFNLRLQLVQLQPQNVVQTESWSFVVKLRSCLILELLPMSVLHVVSSQTFNQVQHDGHVSNFFVESQAAFNNSYLFVDWFDLIGENLVLFDKHVSLNLSPEFGLPVIILQINQSDQIP